METSSGGTVQATVTTRAHPPVPVTDVAHRVSAKVKAAADNVFVPASQLVKDAFLEENVDSTRKPLDAVPRPQHLERYANNHRRRNRPANPSNLHFELDQNHIPVSK